MRFWGVFDGIFERSSPSTVQRYNGVQAISKFHVKVFPFNFCKSAHSPSVYWGKIFQSKKLWQNAEKVIFAKSDQMGEINNWSRFLPSLYAFALHRKVTFSLEKDVKSDFLKRITPWKSAC